MKKILISSIAASLILAACSPTSTEPLNANETSPLDSVTGQQTGTQPLTLGFGRPENGAATNPASPTQPAANPAQPATGLNLGLTTNPAAQTPATGAQPLATSPQALLQQIPGLQPGTVQTLNGTGLPTQPVNSTTNYPTNTILPQPQQPAVQPAPAPAPAEPAAATRLGFIRETASEYPFARCGFAKNFKTEAWFADFASTKIDLRSAVGYETVAIGQDIAGNAKGFVQLGNDGLLQAACYAPESNRFIAFSPGDSEGNGFFVVKYDTASKTVDVARSFVESGLPAPVTFGKRSGATIPMAASRDGTRVNYSYNYIDNTLKVAEICDATGCRQP